LARVSFLRAVCATLTWRKAAFVAAIVLVRIIGQVVFTIGVPPPPEFGILPATTLGVFGMFCWQFSLAALILLIAMLCAEEAVRRGAPAKATYAGAITLAACMAVIILMCIGGPLGVARPSADTWSLPVLMVIDFGSTGGLCVWIYLRRRSFIRTTEALRNAQLRRAQLERQLAESQLASARARIDPGALFDELGAIRSALQNAVPDADTRLEMLIQRLRATLAPAVQKQREPAA
jgi:hypothetical protein